MPWILLLFSSECFRFFPEIMTVELATDKFSTYHYPRHYKNINHAQNKLLFIWHLTISRLGDYPRKSNVLCMFSVLHLERQIFHKVMCWISFLRRRSWNKESFLFGFLHFRRWYFIISISTKCFSWVQKFTNSIYDASINSENLGKIFSMWKNTNCNPILVFIWMLIISLIRFHGAVISICNVDDIGIMLKCFIGSKLSGHLNFLFLE